MLQAPALADGKQIDSEWQLGAIKAAQSISLVRSSTTGDDISTRFGQIPLGPGQQVEAIDSFRNSRIALDGSMRLGPGTFSGYIETDFLNRPPQQPYRFRQYFGRYTIGEWEFSGGQEWSQLRPNRRGINTETDLMNTRAVDAGYHVGLLGVRNRQGRIVRRIGAWHLALSYESGRNFLPRVVHDSKRLHWELTGVASHHRYGGAFAAVFHATPSIDLVTQQSWIQHGGKEALSTVPADVSETGTLEGIEARVGKRLQLYAYAGLVRGGRSTSNRLVQEYSAGFWRELHRDRRGSTVFGPQLSWLDRRLWDGRSGSQVFTMISIRHTFGPAR
jgi:hypothetical protein